ncbi:putative iron-dependent peroxidase [Williamsia limnetica]|uniref:Putative iron-dependent peroxidase n=1 Tax=Williamsia limnetica TaxID=882452 RepID=A0A318RYV0_WILLI|nr:putative iron-dependent peroxidase [Williamsia limnetica]
MVVTYVQQQAEGQLISPIDNPTPQPILSPLTEAAIFLVATVEPGGESDTWDFLSGVTGLIRSVASRAPDTRPTCVVGIGSQVWDRLFSGPRPARLAPFVPLDGSVHSAPSTPGDLLFHIRARTMDVCFELATQIATQLDGAARVIDEVHGFRYFDMRDIIGFVDGTENPDGPAAVTAVTAGSEDPDFAGGSYVLVQKYLHNMPAWNALTTEEQERSIGRSKSDNIEMDEDTKPSNSHTALTVIEDATGVQVQIMRDNMPFGNVGQAEYGTYFIGYSAGPEVTDEMLRNMFLGKPEGNYDRLLDFSTAVTGSRYFVPTIDFLDDPPEFRGAAAKDRGQAAPAPVDPDPEMTPLAPTMGSLRIGALHRRRQLTTEEK